MNPSVLKEFLDYVVDILDIPENDILKKRMLGSFIQVIDNGDNFPINLEDVIEWLDVYPHGLRNTLEKTYTYGIDYLYRDKTTVSQRGRPKRIIYLSNDCFKKLCLKTKSKYSDLVLDYFIAVEKMHREYMLTGILNRQRIDDHEYGYKRYTKTKYPIGNCLYVLRIIQNNHIYYGIGMTKDLNTRLYGHRRTIPGKIEVILQELYEHHSFLEACVHRFLFKNRAKMYSLDDGHEFTEIFETDIYKIKELITDCRGFSQSSEMLQKYQNV